MKKLLLALIFSVTMLTGCYQSINSQDIHDAAIICGGLDKVVEIYSAMDGGETVLCSNHREFRINAINLERVAK